MRLRSEMRPANFTPPDDFEGYVFGSPPVDATAIRAELGFTPAMDLDAGWKETIAALRATAC